jgi:hypothetical protein
VFTAVKLYPANATTNSAFGVTAWENIRPVLARMERIGMPLLIHGEEADPADRHLRPRGGVHRARAGLDGARLSRTPGRARARHDGGRRSLRERKRFERRRDRSRRIT